MNERMDARTAASGVHAMVFAVVLALGGCGGSYGTYDATFKHTLGAPRAAVAGAAPASGVAAAPAPAEPECEVELRMEQLHERTPLLIADVDQGKVGVHAVEKKGDAFVDGICIKRAGQPLRVPQPILVGVEEFGDGDENRFCRPDTLVETKPQVCEWTGEFHSPRPFTFTFHATGALRDYVALIQVWRNGELVYRYRPAPDASDRTLVIKGRSLVVSETLVAASLPPHLADFDLRVLPAGADVDAARLEQQAVDQERQRREHWSMVRNLATSSLLAQVDPALKESVECYLWTLESLQAGVKRFVDSSVPMPPMPHDDCGAVAGTGPAARSESLVELYRRAKGETADALAREEEQILKSLEQQTGPFGDEVRDAYAKIKDAIEKKIDEKIAADPKSDVSDLRDLVRRLDDLATRALGAIDETRMLAVSLRAEAIRLGSDHEAQVAAYTQFAKGLAESRTIFEERKDNPPLADDEISLDMEYGDRFQQYLLNAWFAVPTRMFGNAGADLDASLAIPIVDLIGLRWQFDKSRFYALRWGIVGISAFMEGEDAFGGSADENKAAAAVHTSIGFGTLQIAPAIVFTKNDYYDGKPERRFRLLIGLDLVKLITGENAEVL